MASPQGFMPVILPPAQGLIYKIEIDKWGHQENVFIAWQTREPTDYKSSHGYSGLNIHNDRKRFRIFRDGVEVKG